MIRMTTRTRPGHLVLSVMLLSLSGCSLGVFRGYAEGRSATVLDMSGGGTLRISDAARFTFDDLGGLNTDALETHAIPWKILVASLLVERRRTGHTVRMAEAEIFPILQEFGFILPDTILNWDGAPYPKRFNAPIGLIRGRATRGFPSVDVEVANLGCASCHSGVTYDERGRPQKSVWLGSPNTSLDLRGYSDALFNALMGVAERPDEVVAALTELYPEMEEDECNTLLDHVIPRIRTELPELRDRFGGLAPYDPGGPGSANGLGALKLVLDLYHPGEFGSAATSVGIPDLGDRMLKTALTVDGVYGVPGRPRFAPMTPHDVTDRHLDGLAGVASFFIVPAMGVRPDRAGEVVPRVRDILDFVRRYRPPAFPGHVRMRSAKRGEEIYTNLCASCHGDYSPLPEPRLVAFPNVLVQGDSIQTDPMRWSAVEHSLIEEVSATPHGKYLNLASTGGYVAPPLTGLWASAPYLHNGSVPTIWHLMNPDRRPTRFEVGGHALDFDRMGILGEVDEQGVYRYPAGYEPWSTPSEYDTRLEGQSGAGHEASFRVLTESQKWMLLEYLKLL